ncbi:Pathogenesis-related homeodomain protein, partial [Thalictrum thalictroides]
MQDGGNLDFPKKRVGSQINTSLQKKNSCKNPHIRRWKPKPRSHVKTIASFLSKRKTSELSSNKGRSKRLNGKPFRRRTTQKVNDTSPSERPLSLMLKDLKSLSNKCRGREKTTDKGLGSQKSHRRIRSKKRKNGELDEAARVQRRTRYLLIKMKLEQNLIEAYSGEGWKGQSREKIKPEKELQRAKKQILKCKLGIRDAIRQLESLSSEGCIEDSVIGSDGSVFHEHIFCSKCKLREAFPDNDIILCDGACNCAFHQKCLEPPLATENIPPGDQGWYCKFCECKMAILDGINAHLGTQFSLDSKWQEIFLEAANARDNEDISIHPDGDWPSDDSDDVDFDPESYEISCSYSRMGSEENMSDDASSSGSLYWTSEEDDGLHSGQFRTDGGLEGGFYGDKTKIQSFDQTYGVDTADSIDSNDSTDGMAYRGRQRRDVDYKKLHDEMFGKDLPESEEISEDEDWGPRRRKRRRNESNAATTLVSSCGTENGLSNASLKKDEKKFPSFPGYKRTLFRIPPDAVKKLRAVFAETELPSRVVRESLSKQLGIAIEKINKWFKNARYTALKIRK